VNFGALFKAVNTAVALRNAARTLSRKSDAPPDPATLTGPIEARLTGIVVAALKEAFDRDRSRLDLERTQLEEQRRRAEEAMRLELLRQATDREVGRLRLLAGTAMVGWLASLLILAVRVDVMAVSGRTILAAGWMLLLGAIAASFTAQKAPESGRSGMAALWLLVAGLAATAISVIV
jgi:hypothetical protein